MPNPYFVETLRNKTGEDKEVAEYLASQKEVDDYFNQLRLFLDMSVPLHKKEGKLELKIGIGCTGGKHRSVYIARRLGVFFKDKNIKNRIVHRDIIR